MKPNDVIKFFGSRKEVCDFFGIKPQSLQDWIDRGEIPIGRQYEAQVRTAGRLMACACRAVKPTPSLESRSP
jgi:hypothetical protein